MFMILIKGGGWGQWYNIFSVRERRKIRTKEGRFDFSKGTKERRFNFWKGTKEGGTYEGRFDFLKGTKEGRFNFLKGTKE